MFINPKHAIQEGWVRGIKNPELQIQPNAIDFTVDHLFAIYNSNEFIISTDKTTGKELKQMRGGAEVQAIADRRYPEIEFFHFKDQESYDALSDVYVDLPEGVAAMTIIRSTFNRNGIFLTSGLYDSGYKGHIGFAIHNMCGPAKVEKGTRVGQVIFVSSENAKLYAGQYNHNLGTNAPHIN